MKNTIRITLLVIAVSLVAACSSSTPVQPVKHTGKTYVPTGK